MFDYLLKSDQIDFYLETLIKERYCPLLGAHCESRILSIEGSLVRGPSFAMGHISREVWKLIQNARCSQAEQYGHHHQVANTECTVQPLAITHVS